VARFTLSRLTPGKTYEYALFLDGSEVRRPYSLKFQTQPHWSWRTDPPEFTVAIGSCAYINDPSFDRPGDPYGHDPSIFLEIAEVAPDLMLWLGDNTYYREGDYTPAMMSRRYAHTRAIPEMQPLLGSVHHYAIWDDHDYGPNNSDRSFVLKGTALEVFKRYWANPTYGLPDVPGVFGKFRWGDTDFFLLDNRYHRTPNRAPIDASKVMFGKEQMDWLIDALTSSFAPFKIVVTGGQVLNEYDFHEMMVNHPHERERLLETIVERDIRGVVFLSGDRHHSELLRLTPEGGYPLHDFTSSPLTSGANPAERELENDLRVEGTLVRTQNFGTLTFSGPRRDRSVELRTYGADGALLWSHTLNARDLRVPMPSED
jgi:alkaline phosphatase D